MSRVLRWCTIVAVCVLASCGGKGAARRSQPTTRPPTTVVTATGSPTTDPSPMTAPPGSTSPGSAPPVGTIVATSTPETTVAGTTTDLVPIAFDGPRFDETVSPIIAGLAAPIGQPYSAQVLAPVFALPADAPTIAGLSVTGVMHHVEVDPFDDTTVEERTVGVDGPSDAVSLQAVADGVAADGPWTIKSVAVSGQYTTVLFTDAAGGRFVLVGDADAQPGEPTLQYHFEVPAEAVPVPAWLAALPVPAGGTIIELTEGVGAAQHLGVVGGDGVVVVRISYPAEAADALAEQLNPGLFLGAGFEVLDSPLSNLNTRVDLRMGEWSGSVGVGKVTSGDQLLSLDVIYSFRRTAG